MRACVCLLNARRFYVNSVFPWKSHRFDFNIDCIFLRVSTVQRTVPAGAAEQDVSNRDVGVALLVVCGSRAGHR
jgi:hypothetical protein